MSTLAELFELSLTPTPTTIILGTLFVVIFPILLHFLLSASSTLSSPATLLLLGPAGAGKTALATLLERGSAAGPAATHTTQTPHTVELAAVRGKDFRFAAGAAAELGVEASAPGAGSAKSTVAAAARLTKFLLVDMPGHGKLRSQTFARLTPGEIESEELRGVVFVVDAAALAEVDVLAETGEFLYDVLLALQRRRAAMDAPAKKTKAGRHYIPVLVAANKLDLFTALPAPIVQAHLEAELTRIRTSRSKGLLDSGVGVEDIGSEEQDAWLGEYGTAKFEFSQMAEFDIDVAVQGGNVVGAGAGVDAWWTWMTERF